MRSLLALIALYGISLAFWGCVGVCRFIHEKTRSIGHRAASLFRRRARADLLGAQAHIGSAPRRLKLDEVAVLVAAHNEEKTIHICLDAATRMVDASNIFVASDGSTDATVRVARERGCNVLDIHPNGGKARALKSAIDHFAICERYAAALILDADAQIDEHYLERALPLFDDPAVAAVAGHAEAKWYPHWRPRWSMFFAAYRIRLYRILQALLRYGQTWKYSNVSFIVPGFASMYRCSALAHIDITAPGLIIEDFNMTFELHHKRLGRIAYTPEARCTSQEAYNFAEYAKQVKRWYLGFWQTIRRHGFWPSLFWLSLGVYAVEMLLQSLVFLSLPFVLTWLLLLESGLGSGLGSILGSGQVVTIWLPHLGAVGLTLIDIIIGVFLADYVLTLLVSTLERKPLLLVYGLGFLVLRWIDAFLFLYTLPLAFVEESDGRWKSPTRI
jgi:cellulose synthase/poly-beta-1,6-N-acetylglucosamine synthase-like glycosyltransferase